MTSEIFHDQESEAERQLRERLRRRDEQLKQANLELQQFASVASHDLQEPLRMVISYLDLLQRRHAEALDDEAKHYIREAADGAHRMRHLIGDLLEFAKVGRIEATISLVGGEEALTAAKSNLMKAIKDTAAMIVSSPLPAILINRGHFVSLFQNIIGNALKYHRPDLPPFVRVSATETGRELVFAFRDNGIGIAPQDQQRIFNVFTRLHARDQFPGSGLGLAICKKIVDRYRGRIWVESTPGGGSTFSFALPKKTA